MVSEELMREAGWSEDVIQAIQKAAKDIPLHEETITAVQIQEAKMPSTSAGSAIALNAASEYSFSWPKLQR